MGKRKNRHCRNKQEVLQQMWQRRQQAAGKPEPFMKGQLRTINQIKRKRVEKNRRESRNDVGSI